MKLREKTKDLVSRTIADTIFIEKGTETIKSFKNFRNPLGGDSGDDDSFKLFLLWMLHCAVENAVNDMEMIAEMVGNYEESKSKICYLLLNEDASLRYQEEYPNRKFLDMRLFYIMVYRKMDSGIMATMVSEELIEHWNITEETLYSIARENTPKQLPAELSECLSSGDEALESIITKDKAYVCTNVYGNRGASVVMYENFLESLAEENKGKSIYLLPASIHNMIAIASNGLTKESLYNALKETNEKNKPEDKLSDSVYHYDEDSDKMEIL